MHHKFTPVTQKAKKPGYSTKRKILHTVLIAAVAGAVCWTIGFGSSTHMKASEVPHFSAYPHMNPATSEAERTVFVAHYLSRMLGASDVSEFNNIPDTWMRFLRHDEKNMSNADYLIAAEILAMMRSYQEMKVRRKMNDPIAKLFWARITTVFGFKNGASLFSEGPTSEKASGSQLKFWKNAERALGSFSSPKWVNKQGKVISSHAAIKDQSQIKYTNDNYWMNAWGPEPVMDVKGNTLVTKHHMAAQILNDASRYLKTTT